MAREGTTQRRRTGRRRVPRPCGRCGVMTLARTASRNPACPVHGGWMVVARPTTEQQTK